MVEDVAGTTDLFEIIRTTRSMRRLKPDPVPEALIRQILEAGVCAPSGGNMQRWRFLVIREATVKRTVGAYYKRAWDEVVAPRYRAGEPAPGRRRRFGWNYQGLRLCICPGDCASSVSFTNSRESRARVQRAHSSRATLCRFGRLCKYPVQHRTARFRLSGRQWLRAPDRQRCASDLRRKYGSSQARTDSAESVLPSKTRD